MATNTKDKTPASHKLYARYEYLADIYANKLFNTNSIGMDREDVIQELRLKILTAIKGYGKRWADYKATGNFKPVPIKYYIQAVLNNKLKDMVDEIKKDVNQYSLSIQEHNFDYGISPLNNIINLLGNDKEVVISGVDLLQGLQGIQKDVFCMFMRGFEIKKIKQVYKGKVPNIENLISRQVNALREHKSDLYTGVHRMVYSYQLQEEE